MAPEAEGIAIVGADKVRGGLLVHFSDGLSVLYPAQFLYDVKNVDGNVPMRMESDEEAEHGQD